MATDTVLISHVTGKAWMRASDGSLVALHEGMRVPVDARILTDEGASVTLQANGVPPVIVGQNTDMLVTDDLAAAQPQPAENAVAAPADPVADQVLAALEAGEDPFDVLDPTAAVLTGGGGGGDSFTRLSSVVESTSPLGLAYPRLGSESPEFVQLGGVAGSDDDTAAAPLVPNDPAGPNEPSGPNQPPVPAGPTASSQSFTMSLDEDNTHQAPQPSSGAQPFMATRALFSAAAVAVDSGSHEGVSGSFSFSAAAGLKQLVFHFTPELHKASSVTVTQAQLDALAQTGEPIKIDTELGLMHLTGYNPANGTVTFTYWSDGAVNHTGAQVDSKTGQEYVQDKITVDVVDTLNRSASTTVIDAHIGDTAPTAADDSNAVTEDGYTGEDAHHHDVVQASGNVMNPAEGGNDALRADETFVSGVQSGTVPAGETVTDHVGDVIHGIYGDLVLNADGSYTYTLAHGRDDRAKDVQGLGQDKTGEDVFTYTITDEDGDQSTAKLTITVNGTNDVPTIHFGHHGRDGHAAVSEEGLGAGFLPPHGPGIPDHHGAPDTTNRAYDGGTFHVNDVDGDAVNVRLEVPTDTLTSAGQKVHWTLSHDGQTLTGQIGLSLFGHFIPIADVVRVSLHDNGNGDYSYDVKLLAPIDHPKGGEDSLNLHVPIQVTDSHGASADNNVLTVNIQDDSPWAINDNGGTVTEGATGDAAVLGGNVLLNDRGWGADGPNDLLHGFAWNKSENADTQTELDNYGKLILGADGGWIFILDSSKEATQALAQGQEKDFVLKYTLTDNDGDTSEAKLTIHIKGTNDAPTIEFDCGGRDAHAAVSEEGLGIGLIPLHGAGIPDHHGSPDTTNRTHDSGSFHVHDADAGDTVGVKLGLPSDALTSGGQDVHWTRSHDGQTLMGQIGVTVFGHFVPIANVIRVSLHDNGNGDYSYDVKLLAPIDHPLKGEDALNLDVPIQVTDNHGASASDNILTINIQDDSPEAKNDWGGSVTEDDRGDSYIHGNVLLNDRFGADGRENSGFGSYHENGFEWNVSDARLAEIAKYGELHLDDNGTWSFKLDNRSDATQALGKHDSKSFDLYYTIKDADGDTSKAHLTIKIEGKNDAPELTFKHHGDFALVSEEGLTQAGGNYDDGIRTHGNNRPSGDWTHGPDQAVDHGSFKVSDVDTNLSQLKVSLGEGVTFHNLSGPSIDKLTSHGAEIQWHYDADTQTLQGYIGTPGRDDYRDILKIELHQGMTYGRPNGEYTYTVTLQGAIDHPDTARAHEDVLNLHIPLIVDDRQGGVTESSITVRIEDDSPYVKNQTADAELVEQQVGDSGWSASFDFSGHSNDSGAKIFFAEDGTKVQVKAEGFDKDHGKKGTSWTVDNHGHQVTQDADGLGVRSKDGEPSSSMPNELGYRDYGKHDGGSEALIVALHNQVATSITFELSKFYSAEGERGTVTFYRNGVEVGSQDFKADHTDGSYIRTLDAGGAEFDEVRFTARDNSSGKSDDNSDYALKGITFSHGEISVPNPVLAEAHDQVAIHYGADGAGGIALNVDLDGVRSQGDKLTLHTSQDGLTLSAYTKGDHPKLVFSFTMGEDGEWHFTQFAPIDANGGKDGKGSLTFDYTVSDADGDPATGHLKINLPDTQPVPSAEPNEIVSDEDAIHTLAWADFKVSNEGDQPGIKITELPHDGVLQYSDGSLDGNGELVWFNVVEGQIVSKIDIDAGRLQFVPEPNASGDDAYHEDGVGNQYDDYAQIGFSPVDGVGAGAVEGAPSTLAIDVTPVADAPTVQFSLGTPEVTEGIRTILVEFDKENGKYQESFRIGADGKIVGDPDIENYPNSSQHQNTVNGDRHNNIFVVDGDIKESSNGADGKIDGKDGYDVVFFTKDREHYDVISPYKNGQWNIKVVDRDTLAYIELKGIEALVFGDGDTWGTGIKTTTETAAGHTTYDVNLHTALADTDGSEHLTDINVTGLPDDAVFTTDGTPGGDLVGHAGAKSGTWVFPQDLIGPDGNYDLSDLHLVVPGDGSPEPLNLKATVGSVEGANDDLAETTVPATTDVYDVVEGGSGNDTLPASEQGASSHDVMMGDPGGKVDGSTPAGNYNVALLVDLSYSMENNGAGVRDRDIDRLEIAKDALKGFADKLAAHEGNLVVTLIGFGSQASDPVTVVLNGHNESDNLQILKDAIGDLEVNSRDPGYYTNYEAAFEAAKDWFTDTGSGNKARAGYDGNLTFFLTDGDPTMTDARGHGEHGTATYYHDMLAGQEAYQDLVSSTGNQVYAIGIGQGVSEDRLQFFDNTGNVHNDVISVLNGGGWRDGSTNLYGKVGDVTTVDDSSSNSMEQLLGALDDGFQDSVNAGIGNDTLYGGAGNDILFGDQLDVSWLQWDHKPHDLDSMTGLEALTAYLTETDGADPSNARIHEFILQHADQLAGSDTGEHKDTLFGDEGNDLLFGQGGDDTLHGGVGDDTLNGGAGGDTLHGGAGNDTLIGGDGHDTFVWTLGDQWSNGGHDSANGPVPVDHITDFGRGDTYGKDGDDDKNHQDVLDLSQLLQGQDAHEGDLTQYLHISEKDGGTVINVSSHGTLNADGNGFDQQIVIDNVDLTEGHAGDTQAQMINSLIEQGKLKVDHNG